MGRPRKLLFLTFSFPPLHAVSCVRTASIAKYLSRLGWEVTVVTPDPALLHNVDNVAQAAAEIEEWGVKRICTGHRWRCLSSGQLKRARRGLGWFAGGVCRWIARKLRIDEHAGWYPEVQSACRPLRPEDVDVILATGSPFGTFRVAERLGRRLGRPYVLDYRDPWTGNPHSRGSGDARHRRVEAALLGRCAAATVVTPSWAENLGEQFGVASKVHVLSNGYDPEDLAGVKATDFGHFAVVYAGQFLPPKRELAPVLRALGEMESVVPGHPWRLHYYGPHGDLARAAADKVGLRERVVDHGVVPRDEALSAVRGAGATVAIASVFETGTVADRGIVTGKVFEAIGLGAPILAIAPRGSDLEGIVQTAGGGRVFPGSDIGGMADYLARLIRGEAPQSGDREAYSWPRLITTMDRLLSDCGVSPGPARTSQVK